MLEPERIVRLEPDAVVVLDQRLLPVEEVELRCGTAAEVADAIKTLAVRGAPAIGVAAAYGLALAAARGDDLAEADRVLRASRPTAVNLAWALDEMASDPSAEHARALHAEEVERCRRDGRTRGRALRAGHACAHALQRGRARDRWLRQRGRSAVRGLGARASSSTSGSTRRGRCSRARG